ncbi:uncharacterized protein STEHIDRAFT_93497 [Stereum hirsutum FP-91666 SS1]|uniref:uncharacterized protein n=1 Tax=Stereum hirsutum (strain FP-91666) TaxID=721885 RepID=UPI000440EACB|nr:uncharacterized protein STEHIDRAFT_93497 [Stereum hirsutum FP-91666 SS1]EIM90487.1 hypothetical protein STEHIDRAFT_93497 [Stereum hirsutum FP-91666 SS1]
MAGPNLEVFKFGLYVFFPVLAFLHYGDPEWYTRNVIPYKERLFPSEKPVRVLPSNHAEVRDAVERLKAQKLKRKEEREGHVVQSEVGEAEGRSTRLV